ncbi:saccharopine dehydrogenase NADP-binding domain-containing protein [Candidatus Acetothermia bacterium]|nr:saccharopine dehydrogenase NADP-binding domain-containing protein [Candidatus Acetothermia bacterium]
MIEQLNGSMDAISSSAPLQLRREEKILLIGAGEMGEAIVGQLIQHREIDTIYVAARELTSARNLAQQIGDQRVVPMQLDPTALRAVREVMDDCAVAISLAPYFLSGSLAEAAVETKTHFCTLSGEDTALQAQLALDRAAKEAGVTIIPNCDLFNGGIGLLALAAMEKFTHINSLQINLGLLAHQENGLPICQIFSSPRAFIRACTTPAPVIRRGNAGTVNSLTEVEPISFTGLSSQLERFNIARGTALLPLLINRKVENFAYKVVARRHCCAKIKALVDLGLFDEEPVQIDGQEVIPAELMVKLLHDQFYMVPNLLLIRITVQGIYNHTAAQETKTLIFELILCHDQPTNQRVIVRVNGAAIAVIALMLVRGKIKEHGALIPELAVPASYFVTELKNHGITIAQRMV